MQQRKRDSDDKIIRLTTDEIIQRCLFDKDLSRIRCKKAYPCPVPTCPHHDERYALTDISSIKKHYGREHCPKEFACTQCTKKYALEGDLKAHEKLHFKDVGAESSKRASLFNDWSESEEDEASGDAIVAANDDDDDDDDDNKNSEDEGVTLSHGTTKKPNDYAPLLDVAPDQGEREQRQATFDINAPLDFKLTSSTAINDPKVPIAKENSTPVNTLLASGDPSLMTASANGCHDHMSPRESSLLIPDLNLPPSHGADHSTSSKGKNHRVGNQSLSSTAIEEQYHSTHAPASRDLREPARAMVTGPEGKVDGLLMLDFVANYYLPACTSSQQTVSTVNPSSSSSAPSFGDAEMPANTNIQYSTSGGSNSDGSNGSCVGSAKCCSNGDEQD